MASISCKMYVETMQQPEQSIPKFVAGPSEQCNEKTESISIDTSVCTMFSLSYTTTDNRYTCTTVCIKSLTSTFQHQKPLPY